MCTRALCQQAGRCLGCLRRVELCPTGHPDCLTPATSSLVPDTYRSPRSDSWCPGWVYFLGRASFLGPLSCTGLPRSLRGQRGSKLSLLGLVGTWVCRMRAALSPPALPQDPVSTDSPSAVRTSHGFGAHDPAHATLYTCQPCGYTTLNRRLQPSAPSHREPGGPDVAPGVTAPWERPGKTR